jgi:exonuclease SbcC
VRPLRLELQGFTAYRDLQAIDFTKLDLFVITGPTGAGKSSLLDAMALALYGDVPRLGSQGLGELVSHGLAEARVQLDFSVNGDSYRVARRLPRKGSQTAKFERLVDGRWVDVPEKSGVTAVNNAIRDRIVLDFESFTKAVVLPQGEFARFLKGDPAERRKAVVTLLGLGLYERMGKIARDRAKELRIRGDATRNILDDQYADATPERLTLAETEATTARAAAEDAAQVLAEGRALEVQRADAESRASRAGLLAARLTTLAAELGNEVQACHEAEVTHSAAAKAHDAQRAVVERAVEALATAESAAHTVCERTGDRETLGRLIDAAMRWPTLDKRVSEADAELQRATERSAEWAETAQRLEREAAAGATHAAAATEAETAARDARDGAIRECDRLDGLTKTAEQLAEARREVAEHAARVTTAAAMEQEASEARARADDALDGLRHDHAVAGLVHGLSVGDPCPVCARPLEEHPTVDRETEKRLADAVSACTAATQAHDRAKSAHSDARAKLEAAERQVAHTASALGAFADAPAVETARANAAAALAAAERVLADATEERERADKHREALALAHEKAATELTAADHMREMRRQALDDAHDDRLASATLLHERFGDPVPDEALAQLDAARAELLAAEGAAETAQKTAQAARDLLQELDVELNATVNALSGIDIRLAALRTRAEGLLEEAARGDSALGELPEPSGARDVRASTLANWCAEAATTITAAQTEFETQAYAAGDALSELAGGAAPALEALEHSERTASEQRVKTETTVATLRLRVEQRDKLESQLAADAAQISVLTVLSTELRADHFIDFVVQETLDLLALRASEELLRISDRRYSLVSTAGQFSVIDHVNADERRSVKTLSGGETFMASLSLSLALSKHVSELAGEGLGARLEAVFIDEGFGSLDAETLEEVIDALERLREEELIVGVISHVPTLAERIRSGLQVRKDGNRSVVVETAP